MFRNRHHIQRTLGRILLSAALVMAMSIASPTGANAAGPGGPAGAWSRLLGLEGSWMGRMAAVIRDWTAPRPAASPAPAFQAKDTTCTSACTPPPPPPAPNQGGGLDPDGK